MADDSRLVGMDELLEKLDKLSFVQGRKIIAKALRRGPVLIAEEAERLAPVRTGKLAASMMVSVVDQTASEAIARVGPERSAFYGRFPEFGTAFMAPEAFLQPAYDAKIDEAVAVIGFDLANLIEDASS